MQYNVYNHETKEWRKEKQKWVVHQRPNDENDLYKITISPGPRSYFNENIDDDYDFPKELAEWICEQLNKCMEKCPFVNDGMGWEKLANIKE